MESGLQLQKSVVEVRSDKTFPVLISNRTNRSFRIKNGSVIGKIEKLKEENILATVQNGEEEKGKARGDWLDDLSVPEAFEGVSGSWCWKTKTCSHKRMQNWDTQIQ